MSWLTIRSAESSTTWTSSAAPASGSGPKPSRPTSDSRPGHPSVIPKGVVKTPVSATGTVPPGATSRSIGAWNGPAPRGREDAVREELRRLARRVVHGAARLVTVLPAVYRWLPWTALPSASPQAWAVQGALRERRVAR